MGLQVNARLQHEIALMAARFRVEPEDIVGRSRLRMAGKARRAVWSRLVTRYPGGAFGVTALAQMFDRTPEAIRRGIEHHRSKRKYWKRPKTRKGKPS